jgi:hypothetical protein
MFPRREKTGIMEETFSTRSVPRCYIQGQLAGFSGKKSLVVILKGVGACHKITLELQLDIRWGSVAVNCCCEKLVAEFGNPEEREHPPLEAATKHRH